jgi:Fe2+ transport system protein FeoA
VTLDQLAPGSCGEVGDVTGDGPFRRRLLELGLLPGTSIERTGQAPLGDPLSFRVRGAVLCLRRCDAAAIRLRPVAEAK